MSLPPRPLIVLAEHRDQILRVAKEHRATNVRVFGSVVVVKTFGVAI